MEDELMIQKYIDNRYGFKEYMMNDGMKTLETDV